MPHSGNCAQIRLRYPSLTPKSDLHPEVILSDANNLSISTTLAPTPPPTRLAEAHRGLPKLLDLQILRAIAASLVVVDHTILALKFNGVDTDRFVNAGYLIGHLGVSAFFVLSGLLMVRQSASLFDVKGAPFLFLYRRITRIVPLYWIVLLPLVPYFWSISPKQVILSFLFIPNYLASDPRLSPILPVGWTLNYEMAFYLLFALILFLPRRRGILFLLIVLEAFVALGRAKSFPMPPSPVAFLNFYTQPFMMLFAHGVLIGFVEMELRPFNRFTFPVSPAFLLVVPAIAGLASPGFIGAGSAWELVSFYGVLVVLLCTLSSSSTNGRIGSLLVLLGDASYSTYLVHLGITYVVAWLTARILGTQYIRTVFVFAEIGICIVFANLLGLAIHLLIERRITRALRNIPYGSREDPPFQPA